ncbi:hypothetical protein PMI41_02598 [Phyllobacterium sp. YR531]|nr:hypothetical protein PMI41_02598 [Phyllobacterium sp. YR531]
MGFHPSSFPYLIKLTRKISVQLLRVFFIVRVKLNGLYHIDSPPVLKARPLPRSERPIFSDTPAGSVPAAFALKLLAASAYS